MAYYRDPIWPFDVVISAMLWLLVIVVFARVIYFGTLLNE